MSPDNLVTSWEQKSEKNGVLHSRKVWGEGDHGKSFQINSGKKIIYP